MMVFSKARLVMLSVPKTGSTAYQEALSPLASLVVSDPPELKHSPVFRYNRFFRPMLEKFVSEKMDILAVIREPVSWLGSWHRYRQRPSLEGHANSTKDVSFDEFVQAYTQDKRPSFANVGSQAKFIEPSRNGTAVTHLFRYEDRAGLAAFLQDRLETQINTQEVNVSAGTATVLSTDVEAQFREKCAADFELWDGIEDGGAYTPLTLR